MIIVEETAVIEAPLDIVLQLVDEVETIPAWATVAGEVFNVQGHGQQLEYDWRFTVNTVTFQGHSKVIEQTTDTLITETTGDIVSIWSIRLTPISPKNTMLRVTVEYAPPHAFVEVLADVVIQQLATPEVAQQNMQRFKALAEERAQVLVG
ncbi:MAG: hypothetical protein KDF65_10595 [Anaerolineae bacterium]|nr:hypothetical protein [Anaerolineae bacterium]